MGENIARDGWYLFNSRFNEDFGDTFITSRPHFCIIFSFSILFLIPGHTFFYFILFFFLL